MAWNGGLISPNGSLPKASHPPNLLGSRSSTTIASLYIAYDCIDKAADSIDNAWAVGCFSGDFVEINIDSYHDKRTAFSFTLSVSGVWAMNCFE